MESNERNQSAGGDGVQAARRCPVHAGGAFSRRSFLQRMAAVSLGAISSLLIPNPKSAQKPKSAVAVSEAHRDERPAMSLIIVVEFVIMIGLTAAISNEYQANYWMQQWISQNASPLGFFLSGYVGTLLATVVGVILIIWKLILPQRRMKPEANTPS